MNTSPIYIGGLDRSGKTTLRAFLHSHPNIAIPAVGSNMWTYFYNQYGNLENPENFERCLGDLLKYKHVIFLKPDPDRIRKEFWQGPPTYAHLFSLFLIHFAMNEGKPRWGVQTGLIERYADQIVKAYPGVKFIHMLRDPRDRYAGSLELWPDGKLRAGGSVSRWYYTTYLARRNMRKYPDSYTVVRFEDLIREPENTLKDICEFIGEEYSPEMLTMPGAPEHRNKLIRRSKIKNDISPLSDEFIGIYKRIVPKEEVIFIQSFIGRLMQAYGYELENYHFSIRDKLRYLVTTFPSNMIRMLFWSSQEVLQQTLPGKFGRKPDPKRVVKPKYSKKKEMEKKA